MSNNLHNWKIRKQINCDDENIQLTDEMFKVNLINHGYSFLSLYRVYDNVKELSVYTFDFNLKEDGVTTKVIFTCMDDDDNHISHGYVTKEENEIYTPLKTTKIEFGIMFRCYAEGVSKISDFKLSYNGPQKERKVKLCSVALDYGEYGCYRTCEMNMEQTLKILSDAVLEKPDLIVLTETFYNRRVLHMSSFELANTLDSEPIRILQNIAKENKLYIAFSFNEKDLQNNLYNTGVLLGRTGEIEGLYRKSHLTMGEYEAGYIAGNSLPVFETDFGKVGFSICWDLFFPEQVRTLRLKGAEIIINPTAGFSEERVCERARENGVFIVTSAVDERKMSRITEPDGNVLATAEEKGYAMATVDLNKKYYEYWLSNPSDGEGRNIYVNEMRKELYFK